MNNFILMAEIVQEPQLRYTPDQTPLAEMLVQFPSIRAEDQPATLKVVGWGNLAQEIQQNYHQGDRVILEGRLSMNTVTREEGFKEKRAELTVQRVHPLGNDVIAATTPSMEPTRQVAAASPSSRPPATNSSNSGTFGTGSSRTSEPVESRATVDTVPQYDSEESLPQPTKHQAPSYPMSTPEADVDDIPF